MKESYLEKKIYYHDTDCGGVVYYANYLKHLEETRTEFFLDLGIDLRELMEKGIYFVVSRVEMDYKSPAKYQDLIRVATRIEKIGFSTLHFFQKIFKDEKVLVEARTILVCVNNELRPIRIPINLKIEKELT
ncbi:MAG: YbgC/FadM family acyl-CoA thioesterase [Thermodesulfovibrionales bacterium]